MERSNESQPTSASREARQPRELNADLLAACEEFVAANDDVFLSALRPISEAEKARKGERLVVAVERARAALRRARGEGDQK